MAAAAARLVVEEGLEAQEPDDGDLELEAEDATVNLDSVTGNLGTRLRGQVGGRARLGKLIFMANSAYNPALW